MASRARQKQFNILDKKIPQNPKYKHVKPTIDTGSSITKYMQKLEDIRINYKFRKDEIFRRIKLTTFIQLVFQVYTRDHEDSLYDAPPTSTAYLPDEGEGGSSVNGNGSSPVPSLAVTEGDYNGQTSSRMDTSRSTLIDVAQGIGEMDLNNPPPAPSNTFVNGDCPYLLLDVRDGDEYELCHIVTAMSYPKANLARTANYETKEMLTYKNAPGKIIVIYDEDERIAPTVATTLVERKYENLFMLSGGLKMAYKKFPQGLLTGTPSPSITGQRPPKVVIPARAKYFTSEDMDLIQTYLDEALQDHSVGTSSRLSQASTMSSRMSKASSRMSTTGSVTSSLVSEDRPPFK